MGALLCASLFTAACGAARDLSKAEVRHGPALGLCTPAIDVEQHDVVRGLFTAEWKHGL